jgi:hypothetical protein
MSTHAKMYEIADRYKVVDFKSLSQRKLKLSCGIS